MALHKDLDITKTKLPWFSHSF